MFKKIINGVMALGLVSVLGLGGMMSVALAHGGDDLDDIFDDDNDFRVERRVEVRNDGDRFEQRIRVDRDDDLFDDDNDFRFERRIKIDGDDNRFEQRIKIDRDLGLLAVAELDDDDQLKAEFKKEVKMDHEADLMGLSGLASDGDDFDEKMEKKIEIKVEGDEGMMIDWEKIFKLLGLK